MPSAYQFHLIYVFDTSPAGWPGYGWRGVKLTNETENQVARNPRPQAIPDPLSRALRSGPAGSPALSARTLRTDRWWLPSLTTATVLGTFLLYTIVRALMRRWYWVNEYHYLTPLYSPCLSESCAPGSTHFGTPLGSFPFPIPLAIMPFAVILGFRGTCYYYRKATYRSFLLSPSACAVREPARSYQGESAFPFIVQNSHRYFLYLASLLLLIDTYDAGQAFMPEHGGFGVGLGSLLLLLNACGLWLYTLSCHSCRHIVGGRLKNFSRHPIRYRLWTFVSRLNTRHPQIAWTSLIIVMIVDLYIMAVSADWIRDLRLYK
jgi:hypothetical protein